jgi:hypothetical protein
MWSAAFWRNLAERAVKTAAQALLGMLGTSALGILSVDWAQALSVVGGAVLASVLTSIVGGLWVGPDGSPSWVDDPNAR